MSEPGSPKPDLTNDDFLGGRLSITQPRKGHRAGIEAVLIAAAAPLHDGETVADIGAGVGVAGLCALARVAGARAILVEADAGIAEIARANAAWNGLGERARIVVEDVTARGAVERHGLASAADHAVANPPFLDSGAARVTPDKALAHAAPEETLEAWLRFAAAIVRPGGTLTLVHRADSLAAVLAAYRSRFGAARVLPLHPRAGKPATRILVQGRKGSRAPLAILPGLVLHEGDSHAFRPEVEAILREAKPAEMGR